jgi:hypothetical protein
MVCVFVFVQKSVCKKYALRIPVRGKTGFNSNLDMLVVLKDHS